MSYSKRFKSVNFSELTNVSPSRWAALSGIIAMAFRPPSRDTNSFAEHEFMPLTPGPTLFVVRWQLTQRPDAQYPQKSVVLLMFKFAFDVYSGRVYIDAELNEDCNSAVYDCALPPHLRAKYRHSLDPFKNKTAADLAIVMGREANRVLDAKEPIPHQPTLPEFFLVFARRPVFERSDVLRRDASTIMDKAIADISDEELEEFFWAQTCEADGYVLVPQRYLARQGEYLVHPVDGSTRPEGAAEPMDVRGLWYFSDGRWNAAAQRAANCYVRMGNVLGDRFRNPSFSILKASSFIPADLEYHQFMTAPDIDGLHQRLRDAVAANSTVIDLLVDTMRQEMGHNGELTTDDDLKAALDRPDLPMTRSLAPGVHLVRYSVPPRHESLTWQYYGGHVNLFTVKYDFWQGRVEPVILGPERSPHGRASASFVD